MKEKRERLHFPEIRPEKVQFGCLAAYLALCALMLVTTGDLHWYLAFEIVHDYMIVPMMLFLGLSLASDLSVRARRSLYVGMAAAVWFVLAQMLQRISGEWPSNISEGLGVWLLALPFASVVRDGEKQKGLKLLAAIAVLLSIFFAMCGALLLLDMLPAWLQGEVGWWGARLVAVWHPNVIACLLMIGIACSLYFCFKTPNWWLKGLALVITVLLFLTQVITNSRTNIIMTCALVAGVVFCSVYRGGWKRCLIGILIAAIVFVSLFALSGVIFDAHSNRLFAEMEASAGEAGVAEVDRSGGQGSLSNDMKTLNGRTEIWDAALWTMRCFPEYYLRGTTDVAGVIQAGGCGFRVEHTHNSWLEILVRFGLPGLLFALYFTFLAIRGALFLLFDPTGNVEKKCIALLVLCLLGSGFLEPFLFNGTYVDHFVNAAFCLCVGYVDLWRGEKKCPELV